jgi:hypothetical protein
VSLRRLADVRARSLLQVSPAMALNASAKTSLYWKGIDVRCRAPEKHRG